MQKSTIVATLFLASGFAYLGPYAQAVLANPLGWFTAVLALIVVFALLAHRTFDVGLGITILVSLGVARWVFPDTAAVTFLIRFSSISAFLFLNITLLIGPWARFVRVFRSGIRHRRHVGVTTFLLAQVHFGFLLGLTFSYSPSLVYRIPWVFFGATSAFLLSVLALTSWNRVQGRISLKQWDLLYTLMFLIFAAEAVYFFTIVQQPLSMVQWIVFGIIALGWILLAPWGVKRWMRLPVNGWKQLHRLVYLAYLAVVVHVATGEMLQGTLHWVQILFWSVVILTVGSHIAGWIVHAARKGKRNRVDQTPGG